MKLQFWSIGKPHDSYVKEGINMFTQRITNYYPLTWNIIPPLKNAASLSETDLKKKEGESILNILQKDDFLILLDEKGKEYNNTQLADLIRQCANESRKNIVFLIGGAFGVSDPVFLRADIKWSLSKLVFPHHLVRLILCEQIYRSCSIIRNEKYHHI